ncbi:MAG: hypothetical protein IPM82_11855 [Saprospiraceae bacterium]|nr:hypothetical protein [Saprospiraceae bacterium]
MKQTLQYVQHAQVEEDYGKSQATTTNADGNFKLVFVGVNSGERISFQVKKEGLEVVNTDKLRSGC